MSDSTYSRGIYAVTFGGTKIAFPLFALASTTLAYLIWSDHALLRYLDPEWTLWVGGTCVILSGLLVVLTRDSYHLEYDLFLLGCLLIWLSYWQGWYSLDKPVYKSYPIYFLLLCGFTNYWLNTEGESMDSGFTFFDLVRLIHRKTYFIAVPLVLLLLASVFLPDAYILYPIFVSLVALHFSLRAYLNKQPIVLFAPGRDRMDIGLLRPISRRYGPMIFRIVTGHSNHVKRPGQSDDDEQAGSSVCLQRCFVTILDMRKPTRQMKRVLDRALSTIARNKICVIHQSDMELPDGLTGGVLRLTLDTENDLAACKHELLQWLERKMIAPLGLAPK